MAGAQSTSKGCLDGAVSRPPEAGRSVTAERSQRVGDQARRRLDLGAKGASEGV